MSWSEARSGRLPRRLLSGLALAASVSVAAVLSGCTGFTPVYGEHGVASSRMALSYAAPNSRLEQIIYQDLALRLGKSSAPDAPRLSVTTHESFRDLTSNSVATALVQRQATVVADITLSAPDGRVLFSGQRVASADYTGNAQVLASEAARRDASERAAHSLADTIRLTLLAALAAPAR
jgi:hypothetical protein